jgi:hypothetical protein
MGKQVNTLTAQEQYDALAKKIADELLKARSELQRLRQANEKLFAALVWALGNIPEPTLVHKQNDAHYARYWEARRAIQESQ